MTRGRRTRVSFGSQFQNRPHAYWAQMAPAAIANVQAERRRHASGR